MKTKLLLPIAFTIAAFFTGSQTYAQYKLSTAKENTVKVTGGSNVHGWTMVAQNPASEATFGPLGTEDNIPKTLSSLSFSVNTKSLKSEHNTMDTRTYKTLKADAFPKISYKQSSATLTLVRKNRFNIKSNGILTIAGSSKNISIIAVGEVKGDGTIICSGQQKLKLTDFNIQPPSFMLGAMKVDNDLTIDFNLIFRN